MSMIIEAPLAAPVLTRSAPVRLAAAATRLWRVVDDTGRVIGHVQAITAEHGIRYRARRFHPASGAFRDLGDFWSADDAIDCLRFAR